MRKYISKIYHGLGKRIIAFIHIIEYKIFHLYPHNSIHVIYWVVIDKYKFTKILQNEGDVKNIKIYRLSNWHLTYRYYTAVLNGQEVFIKRGHKYDSLAREYHIYSKLRSVEFEKYLKFLPGCVAYHSDQEQDSYIITKFVQAESLKDAINNIELSDNDRRQIIQKLFQIFKMFEILNVIHMDINPSNFFVKRVNEHCIKVIVFDFGFSIIRGNKKLGILNGDDVQHDLRTLGGEFKLEPFYYDDAYSMLQVMKIIEPSLMSVFPDIWKYISEREGNVIYRLNEKRDEDEKKKT